MAGSVTVTISGLDTGQIVELGQSSGARMEAIQRILRIMRGALNGTWPATVTVNTSAADAVRAAGTLTLSSASGAVGGVINGTTVTATASGGDTASAALVAAAINANTTANKLVSATSAAGVVTVTANVPGVQGSAISFAASGTGVTATGSGKLTNTGTAGAGADGTSVGVYSLA
jgi:phage tail sheath gpL-like